MYCCRTVLVTLGYCDVSFRRGEEVSDGDSGKVGIVRWPCGTGRDVRGVAFLLRLCHAGHEVEKASVVGREAFVVEGLRADRMCCHARVGHGRVGVGR
jgi:hypothetical protein